MKKSRIIIALLVLLGAAPLVKAQIMVSSTTASTTRIYEKSGREKGFVLRPEVSFGVGFIGRSGLLGHLNGSLNYQFNPYFSLGVGSGVNLFAFNLNNPLVAIPLYADVRAYFRDRTWSPFFDLKLGFNNGLNETLYYGWSYPYAYTLKGFFLDGTFGMQYKKFDFGVSVGLFLLKDRDLHVSYFEEGDVQMLLKAYVAYNIPFKKNTSSSTTPSTIDTKKDLTKSSEKSKWIIRPECMIGLSNGLFKQAWLYNLTCSFNYQFNPYFTIGVGAGFNSHNEDYATGPFNSIPLFVNSRIYLYNKTWSPFFGLKIGFNNKLNNNALYNQFHLDGRITTFKGLLIGSTIGMKYNKFDFGIAFELYNLHDESLINGIPQYDRDPRRVALSLNIAYNIPFKKK